ncbi:class A sortase [Leuconostoc sp. LN180020]|uniref:class A sortase n=1 Tax=Leuconostoc sp. LN180020 TaxID=2571156 RepID=UPI00178627E8|nr:class A sortase [Leuconostoc sp. LN180020]QOG10914.1 class A sortase [Leuconostoc sp. LN180020]
MVQLTLFAKENTNMDSILSHYNYLFLIFGCTLILVFLIKLLQQRLKHVLNALYVAVITAFLVISFSSFAVFLYQKNVLNVSDQIRDVVRKNNRAKTNRLIAQDKTSVTEIKAMVMREAQKYHQLKKQGFVSIPNQSILLPIYNDAYSNTGLNAGANYANRSQDDPQGEKLPIMGQGNYGLAAHNFNDGHTGFSGLQESTNHDKPYFENGQLKKSCWLNGADVLLANNLGIYRYVIDGQDTVKETDTKILNATQTPKLTIISCLFPAVKYRIITNAKLVNTYTWSHAPKKYIDQFNLKIQTTNAHVNWYNPGVEEGANGDAGGTKK